VRSYAAAVTWATCRAGPVPSVAAGLVPARRAPRGGASPGDARGHKGPGYIRMEWSHRGRLRQKPLGAERQCFRTAWHCEAMPLPLALPKNPRAAASASSVIPAQAGTQSWQWARAATSGQSTYAISYLRREWLIPACAGMTTWRVPRFLSKAPFIEARYAFRRGAMTVSHGKPLTYASETFFPLPCLRCRRH
jgi:hypothetical protein